MKWLAIHTKTDFKSCYLKALFWASVVFGLSHVIQIYAIGQYHYGFRLPRADGFLVLLLFWITESLVFFIFGVIAALPLAWVAYRYIFPSNENSVKLFCWLGVLAGLIYLPLSAGVSVSTPPPPPDAPTYLQRCIEYMLPMMMAGAAGGYVFGLRRKNHIGSIT